MTKSKQINVRFTSADEDAAQKIIADLKRSNPAIDYTISDAIRVAVHDYSKKISRKNGKNNPKNA